VRHERWHLNVSFISNCELRHHTHFRWRWLGELHRRGGGDRVRVGARAERRYWPLERAGHVDLSIDAGDDQQGRREGDWAAAGILVQTAQTDVGHLPGQPFDPWQPHGSPVPVRAQQVFVGVRVPRQAGGKRPVEQYSQPGLTVVTMTQRQQPQRRRPPIPLTPGQLRVVRIGQAGAGIGGCLTAAMWCSLP
jgi:hypothetical protein